MKNILTLAALCLTLAAPAEIVIYTQTITDTATGNGGIAVKKYGGYLVYDTDTYEVRSILTRAVTKTFQEIGSNAEVEILNRSATAVSLWALVPVFNIGGASFKGACSVMTLGTVDQFFVPKVCTVNGASFESSVKVLHEYTGTVTLQKSASVTANQVGTDFATEISILENALRAKGYTGP